MHCLYDFFDTKTLFVHSHLYNEIKRSLLLREEAQPFVENTCYPPPKKNLNDFKVHMYV
jgi:hypothetical protein